MDYVFFIDWVDGWVLLDGCCVIVVDLVYYLIMLFLLVCFW